MNKKQLIALATSLVLSVMATANKDNDDNEPGMTEDECRMLLGMTLKSQAKALVADTCRCEPADVVWVNAPTKAKKAKEEATDEVTDEDDTDPTS